MTLKSRELSKKDIDLIGIPESFRNVKWEEFSSYKVADELKKYITPTRASEAVKEGESMVFYGGPLTGKSRICAYLALVYRSYGFTVTWADALDIQENVSYGKGFAFEEAEVDLPYIERYRKVDVLIIDDIGSEVEGVRGINRVIDLLRYRVQWNKLTFGNSCLTIDDFKTCYKRPGLSDWMLHALAPCFLNEGKYGGVGKNTKLKKLFD